MEEYPVGRWSIDIWLPELELGVEIDGPQHKWSRDYERDQKILQQFGIAIIRIPIGARKKQVMKYSLEYRNNEFSNN